MMEAPSPEESMAENLTVAPTADPRRFRTPDGALVEPPPGWAQLPPGDAGLTRRVKAAGPSWTVQEKRGRKTFSRGVWAPAEHVEAARRALAEERSAPAYARRREADARRREREQAGYAEDFRAAVLAFLRFAPAHSTLAARLADAVAAHATPVGSGTVARTKRISIEERAEAAVLAWLRHQTTGYDTMKVARVKGERRRVRQRLARQSRELLEAHRADGPHEAGGCALCRALAEGARQQVG
jgi:hypothetical protein